MRCRVWFYVALTGLFTAVFCWVPALALLSAFGLGNGVVAVDNTIFRLGVMGLIGLVTLTVGLTATLSLERCAGSFTTACSKACLAVIVPWLLFCLVIAITSTSEYLPGLGAHLGLRGAIIGICALSALGSALGIVALGVRQ